MIVVDCYDTWHQWINGSEDDITGFRQYYNHFNLILNLSLAVSPVSQSSFESPTRFSSSLLPSSPTNHSLHSPHPPLCGGNERERVEELARHWRQIGLSYQNGELYITRKEAIIHSGLVLA